MSMSKVVKISPKVRRVHLQRYLLSKIVFEVEKVGIPDLCCIFENQLWLERKCLQDHGFLQKFGKSLEELSIILKEINFRQEISDRAIHRLRRRIIKLENLIIPKRNYKDAKKTYSGTFSLKDSEQLGIDKKRIPPKARIGKGYSDKGSAKNVAKDGSPHWSEVATHFEPEPPEEQYNETDFETISSNIATEIFRSFRGNSKSQERKPSRPTYKDSKESKRITVAKSFKVRVKK